MRGVHGYLGGLGGGPSCAHCPLGGLAIRFVWGMGGTVLRFFGPQKFMWCSCMYRCIYGELGTESVMRTVRVDFPVPNFLQPYSTVYDQER